MSYLDPDSHTPSAALPPRVKRYLYNQWAPDVRALNHVGDKWTLLIVRDLSTGPRRFSELRDVLPGISNEQLRQRLSQMVADGLLERTRYRELPPRVDYELAQSGRALLPVLGALARWGYAWSWGPPRENETVDLGAVFRLASALSPTCETTGTVELRVEDSEPHCCYSCAITADGVAVLERPAASPDACISGSRAAWIRTISPEGDLTELEISGRRELAETLLGSLRPTGRRTNGQAGALSPRG
jgi:DNA-binding HxlR family transcriptional regulator